MSLWAIVLIVLILIAFSGFGYGRYVDAPYASPLGVIGALLIIALVVWLLLGGSAWVSPPP